MWQYREDGKLIDNSKEANGGDDGHPMDFLLDENLNLPVSGDIRSGWVVEHRGNVILVDIGAKAEGVIVGREVDRMDPATREALAVGQEITVCVIEVEDEQGNLIVSYSQAAAEQDWRKVAEYLDSKEVCKGTVIGFNRGGLLVKFGELRGFVPNSQLSRDRRMARPSEDEHAWKELVGQSIETKVIEVDRERNRLILSERAAEQELRHAKRATILEELQEGDVREGTVVNLAEFGAFVDIGDIEGLVHLSELSWKRISHPSEKLQVGDEVKVSILSIDRERQRLALSVKRLEPDPWTLLGESYSVGQLVEATITKLTKFGAFAQISDEHELIGLIHISELSEEHVEHPRDVVKPAQRVMVRIIRVDPEQKQLGLSLKQVSSDDFIEADMEMLAAS
jgi:small subunit ribosomal protein S1